MVSIADPDLSLVNDIRSSGDRYAFNRLYDRYSDRVFNFCLAFTGNYDDARDCTQEVFISIYTKLDGFRSEAKFSTWLYRIMSNTCTDMVKKASRKRKITGSGNQAMKNHEGSPGEPASTNPDPLAVLTRAEMHKAFIEALQALNPAFRRIIILRDIEGRSYEEISEITGKKPGTVRSSLARGRQRIATYLKPYRYEL